MIELARSLLHLLTQKIKRGYFFSAGVISVKVNVVADGVCRPKGINPARNQEILCYNPFKELLRVVEKCARFLSDLWIIENGRVTAAHFPRMKKRRPVDVFDQISHRDRYFPRSINPHSQKFRSWRHIAAPIDWHSICARLLKPQQPFLVRFCSVFPAQALVVFARLSIEVR